MIKLISKIALLTTVLLTLTACIDKVDRSALVASSPDTSESSTLVLGKGHYDASCSNCHGGSGTGTSWPINVDACTVADCSSIDALASYIDTYMPVGNVQACSLNGEDSCAFTTATYIINGFSTDEAEPTQPTEPAQPTEPTQPIEPTQPTEPTQPIEPIEPTQPTEPTQPIEPTQPTEPTPPTEPEPEPTKPADLVVGKSHYDSACLGCHGSNGGGTWAINENACLVADCSSIEALASYIDTYMPRGGVQSCSLSGEDSCALTTAAYIINGFSTDKAAQPEPTEPAEPAEPSVQTPLARLTNDEYVNSVRTLLNLPGDSPQINAAKNSLVSESRVKGLTNDASTQTLTQLAVAGYSTVALAASDDFLKDVTSREELERLLDCSALVEGYETNSILKTCVEEFSSNLVTKAYRRPSNDNDTANISNVFENIRALNLEYNKELWDIAAFKTYMQSILQFIMLSPEFLLIVENGTVDSGTEKQLTDHEIATRLALFLAGTLPDDVLIADANSGLLSNAAVRLQHANRLMNSSTGTAQFTTLVKNWLDIDSASTSAVDSNALSTFITAWFVNERPFSDLYQAPVAVEHLDGNETTEPLGVLGLKAFVTSHTQFPTPSFITRGIFVVERLLCEALPDDIPDAALDAGELTPLEVFHTHDQQACASCHKVFDNYGAAFQQFDGENSLFNPAAKTFGSNLDLFDIGDVTTPVTNLGDLGYTMANSNRAPACMAELWYRHSLRRNIDSLGKDDQALQILVNEWSGSGNKSMKSLLRSIVASDSFVTLFL